MTLSKDKHNRSFTFVGFSLCSTLITISVRRLGPLLARKKTLPDANAPLPSMVCLIYMLWR